MFQGGQTAITFICLQQLMCGIIHNVLMASSQSVCEVLWCLPWPVPSDLFASGEGNSFPSSLWHLAACGGSGSLSATLNTPGMMGKTTHTHTKMHIYIRTGRNYSDRRWLMTGSSIFMHWLYFSTDLRYSGAPFEMKILYFQLHRYICLSTSGIT